MNALTVFTMSIKYLKEHLLNTLGNRASGVTDKDVHWVLTVPAIWNDNAKQFMREAAEKVKKTHQKTHLFSFPMRYRSDDAIVLYRHGTLTKF